MALTRSSGQGPNPGSQAPKESGAIRWPRAELVEHCLTDAGSFASWAACATACNRARSFWILPGAARAQASSQLAEQGRYRCHCDDRVVFGRRSWSAAPLRPGTALGLDMAVPPPPTRRLSVAALSSPAGPVEYYAVLSRPPLRSPTPLLLFLLLLIIIIFLPPPLTTVPSRGSYPC